MPVRGADVIGKNLKAFGGGFIQHVNKTMTTVAKMLDVEVTMNIGLVDHSLKDLAALGHPYKVGGPGLHHPKSYQVHVQSGEMISAKVSGINAADINAGTLKTGAFAGVDENVTPHALYVYYGTSKMMPRDFLTPALEAVSGPAMDYLSENLRDFVFNFKPVEK